MADRATTAAKPIWMKQAEEARIKSEAEKTAAAKAAFDATFKALENSNADHTAAGNSDSDDDDDRDSRLSARPAGPVDPSKCLAAGAGIAGGTAGAPSTFTVVSKDSDGRKILTGGANVKVKVSPGVGVGGTDQEGIVKDQNDGTYAVTYAVPKRGNYMVHVECNGRPIMGSPFPVFFSAGAAMGTTGLTPTVSPYPNMVNQTMPNMPNYSGSVSGAFPGLLGMIPGMLPGASGGVVLPGMAGATLGEICREYLNGSCVKTDCKFSHPPHNMLITALAGTTTMGSLSQQPMAPSAAAMAAAQAIVAARQAAQMQAQAQAQAQSAAGDSTGSLDKAGKADALKRTLQVSNLSPLLSADHLKQLFAYCGTVVDCTITDSKHFGYIEYSKPEEATAALALNNMDVGGRPLNVEMAKSLPSKTSMTNNSLPLALQQAVALQQMQFQQALLMQQTMASQQAASRAATMKSATEMAAARAAEISKKLKADGLVSDDKDTKETNRKSRSPSPPRHKSRSRSRSPIKYRRSRRSRSISPSIRFFRDRRSRSPIRYHHSGRGTERKSHRDDRDSYSRFGRRESERSRDYYSSSSRRNKSRSASPRSRRPARAGSISPKHRRESSSPQTRRSSRADSRSPRHHKGSRSSPTHDYRTAASHRCRHSRSRSAERKPHSSSKEHIKDSEKSSGERKCHSSSKEHIKDSEKSSGERKCHSSSKEDVKVSEKSSAERKHHVSSKEEVKDSEKSKHESRKSGNDAKSSREATDDRTMDLSVVSHKRSSVPEEGSLKLERGSNHHKKSKLDVQNDEKSDSVVKDQNGTKEDLETVEEKGFVHKRNYHNSGNDEDDDIHGENRESRKHDRSSSGYKKHEITESGTKGRGSVTGGSSRSRDDRRSSHHSRSRSHRSSRHAEEKSSRDSKSHRRQEKSEEDYKNSQRVDIIVNESRSSDEGQHRTVNSSNIKTDWSRSYSLEDEAWRDSKGSGECRKSDPTKGESEKIDCLSIELDLEGGSKRSSMPQDHEISTISTDAHGELEASKVETENPESYKLVDHKNHISQDAADPDGDGLLGEIAEMAKHDQGSMNFNSNRPQKTVDTIKNMKGAEYKFEKTLKVELFNSYSSTLYASSLSPGDLKKEEMLKNECSKLNHDNHEINHNSADSDHDLIPKEDVDRKYYHIGYESGVQKNDTSAYSSQLVTPEYLLQKQNKDLNTDGELELHEREAENTVCIQEKHPMPNGLTDQVLKVDVADLNMEVERRQDASRPEGELKTYSSGFEDPDFGDVGGDAGGGSNLAEHSSAL